ncbi:hypothetical protein P170DRAFT_164017 [Aspergillus steynii IBT 23096]|uniref:Zn(2)-C6 fungal-type domain-containing protein n=1 Tax=Aspergillus steynii IBT 23096 TaxID=1392250 RepID=A0A2I2GEK4_9EURO|nr:uncharacterized protein P170DRAFT_164017 [Aspergillus steynii IBT 23096]PLB51313.1 hypothetical protein P170DRAFT_164017 [Aspergillus steynii IBT 23096]
MMSRPCRTCQARKKACDKSHPHCKTCELSGRKCLGYETGRKVFINLDSNNLKGPIRPLISQAISTSKDQHIATRTLHSEARDSISISPISLNTLDLSAGEFSAHFITLWTNFNSRYACTPDAWSVGISSTGPQNSALDLALIALATMRLSCSPESTDRAYHVFSLSAYSASLQIFSRLLNDVSRTDKPKSVLVVISLVFTLFEAVQQRPTQIYGSGWAGHLNGALALMQKQGPGEFQLGATHEAFRKLREMAILYLLSRGQSSFLSRREWMTIPWKKSRKTHRDRLYDIAAKVTSVYSIMSQTTSSHHQVQHVDPDSIQRCQQLHTDLLNWRIAWLKSAHPEFLLCSPHKSTCIDSPESKSYFPDPKTFPTNEFSYLVAEWTALVLLLNNLVAHVSRPSVSDRLTSGRNYEYPSPHYEAPAPSLSMSPSASASPSITHSPQNLSLLSLETKYLHSYLHFVLQLPCFGYSNYRFDYDEAGITEGRCRSLLPNWVLSTVGPDRTSDSRHESQGRGRDQGAEVDTTWWAGLSDRLNFGVF